MIRHLVIAALRNMAANKLQTAIAVLGLSIGITAALLMGLVVRNQTSHDHFIPGHERVYQIIVQRSFPGRPTTSEALSMAEAAPMFRLNAPEVESIARIMPAEPSLKHPTDEVDIKHGDVTVSQKIYWADPELFDVLPLPVFRGDLKSALRSPDGLVMSRSDARKIFGRDDVVGQVVQMDGQPMTVRAVIEDFPLNGTSLENGVFASGLASFSPIAQYKSPTRGVQSTVITYLRLKPNASIADLEKKIPGLIAKLVHRPTGPSAIIMPRYALVLVRIDELPLFDGLHAGAKARLAVSTLVGLLVLFIASINFVNLLTVRAARRAMEVGLRKVCGATQPALIQQFLGESILTVFFSTCFALALGEWLLPLVNSFVVAGAVLEDWRGPFLPMLLIGVVALGILAGAYPAFVLSSFRPAAALKGFTSYSPVARAVRNGLVVLQFAILIILIVAATTIYQQHVYSTREGLRANIDQMLVMNPGCFAAPFRDEVRKLPGVEGAACTNGTFTGDSLGMRDMTYKGQTMSIGFVEVDWNSFSLYGIKPVAGAIPNDSAVNAPEVVLNETAVKRLGFASPRAAIGQGIPAPIDSANSYSIAAVVPDFAFTSVEKDVDPMLFTARKPGQPVNQLSIKLNGQQISETLAAINQLWTQMYHVAPYKSYFLDEHLQEVYISLLRQAQLLAIFSGVAVFLAVLGLLGLSISTAERRIKEIGIRKAMGASRSNVTSLLLLQFVKPVLGANLIAWPVAFFVMNNWLNGFAHHIKLNPLVFVGATLLAIIVALITVAVQSMLVARQKPVLALRYE